MGVLFTDSKSRIDYVRRQLAKHFPDFKTGGYFFRKFIKDNLSSDAKILDAGCGRRGILYEFKDRAYTIGLDEDKDALDANNYVDEKIAADLADIPLPDSSVDIVTSEFVIEHLSDPRQVMSEVYRVLKPGGTFIFMTPNLHNPIMLLSRLAPIGIHNILLNKLLKKQNKGHPTFYRANTFGRLVNLGKRAGFDRLDIKRAGNPEYLGFTKGLANLAVYLEKGIDNNILQVFKMYLVGCFKK